MAERTDASDHSADKPSSSMGQGSDESHDARNSPPPNVVDVAVKFLQNPNTRNAPLAQKKAFLKRKGLRDEEIALAIERSGMSTEEQLGHAGVSSDPRNVGPTTAGPGQFNVPPQGQPWRIYGVLLAAAGAAGYGLYHVYQLYLQPLIGQRQEDIARIQRLEASVDTAQANVNTTVAGVQTSMQAVQELLERQQEQLQAMQTELSRLRVRGTSESSLSDVRAELTTLKGLLLSRHQFPSFPNQRPSIPAWQRGESTSASVGGSLSSSPLVASHSLQTDELAPQLNGVGSAGSPLQIHTVTKPGSSLTMPDGHSDAPEKSNEVSTREGHGQMNGCEPEIDSHDSSTAALPVNSQVA